MDHSLHRQQQKAQLRSPRPSLRQQHIAQLSQMLFDRMMALMDGDLMTADNARSVPSNSRG